LQQAGSEKGAGCICVFESQVQVKVQKTGETHTYCGDGSNKKEQKFTPHGDTRHGCLAEKNKKEGGSSSFSSLRKKS